MGMRGCALVLLAAATACGGGDRVGIDGGTDGDVDPLCEGPGLVNVPFRDQWRQEVDAEFDHADGEITSITIGGPEYESNFANRGDVIVLYDAPPGRILVEMRRFTFRASEVSAVDDFEHLWLWAFDAAYRTPQPPSQMLANENCVASGRWHDGCAIRVYYDGQSQLVRSGADLRVHLPPDYTGSVEIYTEDNDAEGQYLNRGNVCVDGARGAVDVQMQNGVAFVKVADDVTPTPSCPADLVAACDTWEAGAWASSCPCIDQGYPFGGVKLATAAPGADDVTVDVPPGLWSSVRMSNDSPGQDHSDPDLFCEASLELPNVVYPSLAGNDFPWQSSALSNLPSENATKGAGFAVDLTSSGCGPVAAVENPEDYDCDPEADPPSVERGNLRTCEGCLGATSCADLLP